MIREDLFKEYPDNHGHTSKVLDVSFEIDDYQPRWAEVTGSVELVIANINREPCVIGYAKPNFFASDQDGEDLGEYDNIDKVFELYGDEIMEIEADTHASDLRG